MSSPTLRFLAEPSTVNFGGEVQAWLACTGNSGMDISVEVRRGDSRAGTMEKTTECVIVFGALDDHGKPVPVAGWNPKRPGKVALAANVRARLTASRAHPH